MHRTETLNTFLNTTRTSPSILLSRPFTTAGLQIIPIAKHTARGGLSQGGGLMWQSSASATENKASRISCKKSMCKQSPCFKALCPYLCLPIRG